MASHYIQNKIQLPAMARAPIGPGPYFLLPWLAPPSPSFWANSVPANTGDGLALSSQETR